MTDSKRILYHQRTRAQDAQGIHIRALSKAFRQLGHSVKMVGLVNPDKVDERPEPATQADDQDTATTLFGLPIPHVAYELMALGYNAAAFASLSAQMLVKRPDLVYERYSMFTVGGLMAAKLFRVPFVLEVNAPLSEEQQDIGDLKLVGLAQGIEDYLCRHATATVVVTEAMKEIFVQRGLPAERFVVMPNGVDREHFNPQVQAQALRQQYQLEGKFVAAFVGWIRPWHGVDSLIDALAMIKTSHPNIQLLIIGDGPALPELREQAKSLGIADRVTFTGPVLQEQVPQYLSLANVAVQPDVTDYASPIKLFEYLAMGKPVIAANKPNIREVVTDGEQALLVRPKSAEDIAAAMVKLHDNPELAAKLAAGAVSVVEQRGYFWDNNAQRVLDAID